jgi:DNA-binding CsgD family transcriptional regulator
MIGRSAELERLAGLVGASRVPTVALVAGEAGIGKTRLVQELIARIPKGTVILAGQADPDSAARPFALMLDVLGHSAEDDPESAELEALVRSQDVPSEERSAAAVKLARRLAGGGPAVLLFEDLHWADAESLGIFERLAEPDGGRLLLVGTYRPDGLSRRHPASELLPRLERRHSVTHVELRHLEEQDVAAFLDAVFGQLPTYRITKALWSRTGGNPFFLEELIAATDTLPNCDLDEAPLPWTVTELVRAQFEELDPEVRSIVAAASELGRRVPFDVLAAVTETPEHKLIPLLRAAVDSGLLVETETDVFGFHHEIAREAIASGLLGREQRRLHEAAFEVLRAAGSRDHAAMARHAYSATRYDDMVDEARLGAREFLNHGSTYQALQLAELGLEEADTDRDLLEVATRAAYFVGLTDDAAGYGDRWLTQARADDDVTDEARALALRMRIAFELADLDGTADFTDELIAAIDRLPTDQQRARAMVAVAQSYMLRDKPDPTCEWADKAFELAVRDNLPFVRISAMIEKGSALLWELSTRDEGRALLEAAAEEAERIDEPHLAARAINNLVWSWLGLAEADHIRELIDRIRRNAVAAGWLPGSDTAEVEAQLAAVDGDLDGAIAYLDNAPVERQRQVLNTGRWKAVPRAGFALEAGDLAAAERYAAEAKPVSRRSAAGVLGLDFHIAARKGDLAQARALIPELLAAIDDDGSASPSQAHDLVAAGLRAGMTPDELRPIAERMGTYHEHRLQADDAWRQLLDAQFAEAEGRTEDAASLYVAAADKLATTRSVIAGHRGSAHVAAARTLIALDRLDEARAHVRLAEEALARWRGWRVDELRAVERRLGLGDEPSGPAALTPREREVAALLAEGLTNTQLAQRLYISPRTAAVHVSNILSKLGMSSRAEIAAWATRSQLNEPDA